MSVRQTMPVTGSVPLLSFAIRDLAMLNPFQRACADAYGGGDFAHVQDVEQAREAGDTLFAFLMIELASGEGCSDVEEALRRLDLAIADIQKIAEVLQRGGSPAR